GVTVFETQQASDLTYRMFDYNRLGLDGKPRQLHVKKAADVLDYARTTTGTLRQVDYHFEGLDRTALIADENFIVERVTALAEPATMTTSGRPLILMTLDHAMEVSAGAGSVVLERFQTALIPAAAGRCTVASSGPSAPFMFVTPPASDHQLPARLLAAGVAQADIDRFMAQFRSPDASELEGASL
ncbi:MAG: hypothetical protein JO030_06145, partial [Candidatus Eremiobacteraeota bacterium]|nr:hypothetical protein [Candidatus Eremiobacteraeota bacterium]